MNLSQNFTHCGNFIQEISSFNHELTNAILKTQVENVNCLEDYQNYNKTNISECKFAFNNINTQNGNILYIRCVNQQYTFTYGYCILRIPHNYSNCQKVF